jgi:hypothetical protein
MYTELERIFRKGPVLWSERNFEIMKDLQVLRMLSSRAECLRGRRIAITNSDILALVPGDAREGI